MIVAAPTAASLLPRLLGCSAHQGRVQQLLSRLRHQIGNVWRNVSARDPSDRMIARPATMVTANGEGLAPRLLLCSALVASKELQSFN